MTRCDYEIVSIERTSTTIRDLNLGRMSVTNDAENVIDELRRNGHLPVGRRLFYYDSEGELSEITWDETGMVGFA